MPLPTITVSPFMSPADPDDNKPTTDQQQQKQQQTQQSAETPPPAPQTEPIRMLPESYRFPTSMPGTGALAPQQPQLWNGQLTPREPAPTVTNDDVTNDDLYDENGKPIFADTPYIADYSQHMPSNPNYKPNGDGVAPTSTLNLIGPDGKTIFTTVKYDPDNKEYILPKGYRVDEDQQKKGQAGYKGSPIELSKKTYPELSTFHTSEKLDPEYKNYDQVMADKINDSARAGEEAGQKAQENPSPGSTFFGRDWQVLRDKATSDSQFVAELQAGLLPKEEQEKRERAARRINGIQHLGNMLSAFSNLYYTRGGAPSQTLPTVTNPDLEVWRTKQRSNISSYQDWVDKKDKAIWDREYKLMTAAHRQEMDKANLAIRQAKQKADEETKKWEAEKAKWGAESEQARAAGLKAEAAKKEWEAKKAEQEALDAHQKAEDAHAVAQSTANKNNAEAQAAAVKAAAAAKESAARAEKARADAVKSREEAKKAASDAKSNSALKGAQANYYNERDRGSSQSSSNGKDNGNGSSKAPKKVGFGNIVKN